MKNAREYTLKLKSFSGGNTHPLLIREGGQG